MMTTIMIGDDLALKAFLFHVLIAKENTLSASVCVCVYVCVCVCLRMRGNKNETLQRLGVAVYGSECWSLRKEDERSSLVAEMRLLRRIGGRRREKIRNEKKQEKSCGPKRRW